MNMDEEEPPTCSTNNQSYLPLQPSPSSSHHMLEGSNDSQCHLSEIDNQSSVDQWPTFDEDSFGSYSSRLSFDFKSAKKVESSAWTLSMSLPTEGGGGEKSRTASKVISSADSSRDGWVFDNLALLSNGQETVCGLYGRYLEMYLVYQAYIEPADQESLFLPLPFTGLSGRYLQFYEEFLENLDETSEDESRPQSEIEAKMEQEGESEYETPEFDYETSDSCSEISSSRPVTPPPRIPSYVSLSPHGSPPPPPLTDDESGYDTDEDPARRTLRLPRGSVGFVLVRAPLPRHQMFIAYGLGQDGNVIPAQNEEGRALCPGEVGAYRQELREQLEVGEPQPRRPRPNGRQGDRPRVLAPIRVGVAGVVPARIERRDQPQPRPQAQRQPQAQLQPQAHNLPRPQQRQIDAPNAAGRVQVDHQGNDDPRRAIADHLERHADPRRVIADHLQRQADPRQGNADPRPFNNVPRLGNDVPRLENDVPRQGNDVPRLGNDIPRQGNDVPSHGNDVPRQGNDVPRQGDVPRPADPRMGNIEQRPGNPNRRRGLGSRRPGNANGSRNNVDSRIENADPRPRNEQELPMPVQQQTIHGQLNSPAEPRSTNPIPLAAGENVPSTNSNNACQSGFTMNPNVARRHRGRTRHTMVGAPSSCQSSAANPGSIRPRASSTPANLSTRNLQRTSSGSTSSSSAPARNLQPAASVPVLPGLEELGDLSLLSSQIDDVMMSRQPGPTGGPYLTCMSRRDTSTGGNHGLNSKQPVPTPADSVQFHPGIEEFGDISLLSRQIDRVLMSSHAGSSPGSSTGPIPGSSPRSAADPSGSTVRQTTSERTNRELNSPEPSDISSNSKHSRTPSDDDADDEDSENELERLRNKRQTIRMSNRRRGEMTEDWQDRRLVDRFNATIHEPCNKLPYEKRKRSSTPCDASTSKRAKVETYNKVLWLKRKRSQSPCETNSKRVKVEDNQEERLHHGSEANENISMASCGKGQSRKRKSESSHDTSPLKVRRIVPRSITSKISSTGSLKRSANSGFTDDTIYISSDSD